MPNNLSGKRDRVIEIVKTEGPLLPITISKRLDLNTTFSSAILSELVDNRILKITSIKYGGSPFYYIQGQEEKLQDLMKHLNEKDKNTAELLKKEKILRDRDLDNLKRFGLRQMKDFAKPVNVTFDSQTDLFWRWYLAEDKEVNDLIGKYLEAITPKKTDHKDDAKTLEVPKTGVENAAHGQIKLQQVYEQELKKEKIAKTEPEVKIDTGKIKAEKKEKIKEKIEKIKNVPEKTKLEEDKESEVETEDEDHDPLGRFLVDNQIDVLDQKILRKNKEINYIVGINTVVGKGVFFLKYKNKGKINEADLSLAMHEAGKLPLIFLSTGELNKKARELLGTEFKGIIFKKI